MSGKGGASRHQDLLAHMLGAIRLARSYVEDLTKDAFLADTKTQQAVILNIVIIGEAATQLVAEYPEFAALPPDSVEADARYAQSHGPRIF